MVQKRGRVGRRVRGRFRERLSMYTVTQRGERKNDFIIWATERHFVQYIKAPIEGSLGADNMAHLHPATSTQRVCLLLLAQRCYIANGNFVYNLLSIYEHFFLTRRNGFI